MSAMHFDTLEAATKLKESGFTDQQASALAQLQRLAIESAIEQAQHDYHLDDVATKRDLKELELKLELKIAETKADSVRWVVGVGVLQITIITALLLKIANQL